MQDDPVQLRLLETGLLLNAGILLEGSGGLTGFGHGVILLLL
jgi:hypothetical protein